MAVFCDRSLSLVADDEDARGGFDNVVGDGFELVDFEDAGDLRGTLDAQIFRNLNIARRAGQIVNV